MSDFRHACHMIKERSDRIMELWERRTRREPWLSLPKEARVDHVPELLDALVDAILCNPTDEDARARATRVALKHGAHRCRDGFDDRILYQEYHLLRACVWVVIQEESSTDGWEAFDVISRLDVAITGATNASLHGFHSYASQLDEGPDEMVQRLLEQGPWPTVREE